MRHGLTIKSGRNDREHSISKKSNFRSAVMPSPDISMIPAHAANRYNFLSE
jgi:hypothetical protein